MTASERNDALNRFHDDAALGERSGRFGGRDTCRDGAEKRQVLLVVTVTEQQVRRRWTDLRGCSILEARDTSLERFQINSHAFAEDRHLFSPRRIAMRCVRRKNAV